MRSVSWQEVVVSRIHTPQLRSLRTETPYEAEWDPEVSCPWTTKPFPTDPTAGTDAQRWSASWCGESSRSYSPESVTRSA